MANLDPKRYDLAVKQLQDLLNGNTSDIQNQKKVITIIQTDFEDQKSIVAKEISSIFGEFEVVRSDIADFNTTVTNKLIAVDGEIQTISGNLASYKEIITNKFTASEAEIKKISGDLADYKKITTGKIDAAVGEIAAVSGDLADYKTIISGDFSAVTGKIDNLTTNMGQIRTLVFGSATGTSISTDFANAVASTIGTGYIKDAMIDSLSFDKLSGFDINTTKFTVHSEDGKSQWKDNTILISDAARPRVQIGKDALGDYNMYVWDAAGALMFDALGLTESGIQREIIKNDMVAQDAAINAAKLDIDSLFKTMNEDGSHTLKSTKVYFDSEKQTLDVVFNSMTTNITGAQNDAERAQVTADAAKTAADTANAAARSAQADLDTAKTNLASVTGRVDVTEADVAAAQKAVEVAQAAADKAKSDATAANAAASKAQATADTADKNAQTALTQISVANGEISTLVQSMTSMGNDLSATKTQAEQTADRFKWIVKSGTNSTDFTLTDKTAELVADAINLNGLVTFSGLGTDVKGKIDGAITIASSAEAAASQAKEKAETAVTDATDAKASASNAESVANTANTNANSALSKANSALASVTLQDTRNTNEAPSWYYSHYPKRIVREFKTCSSIYLSGVGHTYCSIETVVPWNDSSGGWPTQIAYIGSGNVAYKRIATSMSTWGVWESVDRIIANWCSENDKTLIDGGKIYTKSITANQVDVNDIFAQDIRATGSISGARLYGAKEVGIGNYELVSLANGAMLLRYKC